MRYANSWFAPLFVIALAAALLAPAPAHAQPSILELPTDEQAEDDQGMSTIAVVGVTSYDKMMSDIGFLGGLGGRPEAAQMIDGMIALFTQGKGLVGLDKTKPWGMVLRTDGAQFVPLVCLPINDLDAILDLLIGFQIQSEEIGDGVYEILAPDQIVYAKQVGEWVCVGQTEEALGSAPADPSGVLTDLTKDYDLAARLLVQNVPEAFKKMAIEQLWAGVEAGLQQWEEESAEDLAEQRELAEASIQPMADAINDLDELTLGWAVDAEAETTHLDMTVTAVPGSAAAQQFASLQDCKTRFSGFVDPDASVLMRISGITPPEQIEQQREQLSEMIAQMKTQLANEIENREGLPNDETRETMKLVMEDLLDVLEATSLTGVTDIAVKADVSTDNVSVIGAAALQKTEKIEDALRKLDELAKNQDGQGGRKYPGVRWNAGSHSGAAFHTLVLPFTGNEPARAREMLGGAGLETVVGIGEGVAYFGVGKNAIGAVKQAIDASEAAGMVSTTPMEVAVAVGDLMDFAYAAAPELADAPMAATLEGANKILAESDGQDHVRVTVEPLRAGARYRLKLEKGVLRAYGAAAAAAQQNAQPGF